MFVCMWQDTDEGLKTGAQRGCSVTFLHFNKVKLIYNLKHHQIWLKVAKQRPMMKHNLDPKIDCLT